MPDASDMELLRDYNRQGSEDAFAALVRRHINLVYSAALRHVANTAQAEEITQAVFVILACKAASLRPDTIIEGWLYETTRLTALRFLRGERRRQFREQEAYMQSTLQESAADNAWEQLAPLLDEAMSHLGKTDRDAVVLRFFKEKNLREVAMALNVNESAAQRRVHRAVEKLRKFFTKRGVVLQAGVLTAAISTHSVHAAPAGLANFVTPLAVAKGATAGASTITLIKGALKLMAWTKAKTVGVAGVVVLLAAGTTTITVLEIQAHQTYSWQAPHINNPNIEPFVLMDKAPPQVRILPSKYVFEGQDYFNGTPASSGDGWSTSPDGKVTLHTNEAKSIGLGVKVADIVTVAYDSGDRTSFKTDLPTNRYDFIANLPHGALKVLQEEIRKKFGLVGRWVPMETNVLVLKPATGEIRGIKPTKGWEGIYYTRSMDPVRGQLAVYFDTTMPLVVDKVGLTNHCDVSFAWPKGDLFSDAGRQATREALRDQLGLELVPGREPVEMLVVEKTGN